MDGRIERGWRDRRVAVPGARYLSANWTDKQGNLWLFGGYGPDTVGNTASLSDLWKYSVRSGQWTCVGGSSNGCRKTALTGLKGRRHLPTFRVREKEPLPGPTLTGISGCLAGLESILYRGVR